MNEKHAHNKNSAPITIDAIRLFIIIVCLDDLIIPSAFGVLIIKSSITMPDIYTIRHYSFDNYNTLHFNCQYKPLTIWVIFCTIFIVYSYSCMIIKVKIGFFAAIGYKFGIVRFLRFVRLRSLRSKGQAYAECHSERSEESLPYYGWDSSRRRKRLLRMTSIFFVIPSLSRNLSVERTTTTMSSRACRGIYNSEF